MDLFRLAPLGLTLLLLSACSGPEAKAPAAAPAPSTAVAKGVVENAEGLVRLVAPADGAIGRVFVEEGQSVQAGQSLAELESGRARIAVEAADASAHDAAARVKAAQARQSGAAREAARLSALAKADAGTGQDADQAAAALAAATADTAQSLAGLQEAQAHQQLARMDLASRSLRAPVAGVLLRRTAVIGSFVTAGTPLFILEPRGPRVVRAELDESFAKAVAVGAKATVLGEYGDGQGYDAVVLRVSGMFGESALSDDATAKADSRVVAVVLSLPTGADFKLGQRVLVRFKP
jgi:RND family efflux transporter MFP subunit